MSNKFLYRHNTPELLDDPLMDEELIHRNMRELETINALLGGHQVTIAGINKLLKTPPTSLSITDVGCGAGDTLVEIQKWGKKKNIKLDLRGIDLHPSVISYAQKKYGKQGIRFEALDASRMNDHDLSSDIITCNLVCHHLYHEDLSALLRKMVQAARIGVVINDLHRHPLAFYSIRWLTSVFSRSVLVKNDAPLSVLKGFRKNELESLCKELAFDYHLEWKWAFRYLLILRK